MAFNLKYYKGITTSDDLKKAITAPTLISDDQVKGIRMTAEEHAQFLSSPHIVISFQPNDGDNRSNEVYIPHQLGSA